MNETFTVADDLEVNLDRLRDRAGDDLKQRHVGVELRFTREGFKRSENTYGSSFEVDRDSKEAEDNLSVVGESPVPVKEQNTNTRSTLRLHESSTIRFKNGQKKNKTTERGSLW